MDGKLDYKEGTVLMNHPANSVYQQVCIPVLTSNFLFFSFLFLCFSTDLANSRNQKVIERTKGSFFRTSVLRYVCFCLFSPPQSIWDVLAHEFTDEHHSAAVAK